MILIISKEQNEKTTEVVIDWLNYYNGSYLRINGENVYKNGSLFIDLIDNKIDLIDKKIDFEKINITWFRRWSDREFISDLHDNIQNDEVFDSITQTLVSDSVNIRYFFTSLLPNKWLTDIKQSTVNKLLVLKKAKHFGLSIPPTIICSNKDDLNIFYNKYKCIITKDLSISWGFNYNKSRFYSTCKVVTKDVLSKLPQTFMPSLFQEKIEKKIEIRTFYLNKELYSMAIFSQLDEKTQIDFRNYNSDKPNRFVPYKLPYDISEKLIMLMENLNLDTGSIDLIKDIDDNFLFLEVNPIGQFEMVSNPCNYYLEKKVAKYLMQNDKK